MDAALAVSAPVSTRLTFGCKEVLTIIRRLAKKQGYCWASQKYLAERLEMPVRTLKRHLQTLRNYGLVTCRKQGRDNVYFPEKQGPKLPLDRGQIGPYFGPYKGSNWPLSENLQYNDELKMNREGKKSSPPISETDPKQADSRINFWEACQLNRSECQTDEFILGCELIANFRTWNRPNDPQMFMAIWWKKFSRCKPGDFREAVDAYIQSTGTPFDRPGVADWLQNFIRDKNKPSAKKLPPVCSCGKARIDGEDRRCYRCRKPSLLKETSNESEPQSPKESSPTREPRSQKESQPTSEPKKAKETSAKNEPSLAKESRHRSEPGVEKESLSKSEPSIQNETLIESEPMARKQTSLASVIRTPAQIMREWLEP